VNEDTGNRLFGSIAKQLVKSIEDSAPGHQIDIARYTPAQHDEFIGDTEPFYYGLFQKPKPGRSVKPPLPFSARPRVGLVSSKQQANAKKPNKTKGKKNK